MCVRSVWNVENALSTVFTAAFAFWSGVHVVVVVVVVEFNGDEEGGVVGDGDGECVGEAVGEAVADGEADGLALAWVSVIVVTLPAVATVAVTSAPVVPRTRTLAKTPDFACSKSSRSRSSMDWTSTS
jgi:hypothetical protein